MKYDLIKLSKDIQLAFNKAVETQDDKDWEEFDRLDNEYYELTKNECKKSFKHRMSNEDNRELR